MRPEGGGARDTSEYRMREYGVFLLKKSGKTVYRKKRENVQKSPRLPHVHGEIAPPCRTTAPLHKNTENL